MFLFSLLDTECLWNPSGAALLSVALIGPWTANFRAAERSSCVRLRSLVGPVWKEGGKERKREREHSSCLETGRAASVVGVTDCNNFTFPSKQDNARESIRRWVTIRWGRMTLTIGVCAFFFLVVLFSVSFVCGCCSFCLLAVDSVLHVRSSLFETARELIVIVAEGERRYDGNVVNLLAYCF